MTKQLTSEQLAALEQYERYFHQAVDARYCSYPGLAAIDHMLRVWNDLTGQSRKVSGGCPDCIFHLVSDLGTVYFAQKAAHDAVLKAEAERQAAEDRAAFNAREKAVSLPATATKPASKGRTPKVKNSPAKAKK